MFALRRILSQPKIQLYRNYASTSKLIEVSHDKETGISTVSFSNPPVNSLNTKLLNALNTTLKEVQKNCSAGVILTSTLPSIFSAGLDIMEMYNRDEKSLVEFWTTLQDTWLTLYSLEIPTAAAINGASPAGGCVISLSCEYRVMVEGKHTIGLNETQLGIVAPHWFKDLYIGALGYRTAELALLRGSLFRPEKALEIGLVDELATDKADAIKKCEKFILDLKAIPRQGVSATKLRLRESNLRWLIDNRDLDLKTFVKFSQLPKVQANLKMYIESLKQKK